MTLCALLTTPSAYRKVQDEVDAFYAQNPGDVISYAQVKTLPYLQAVIRESMRLWPPSAGLFSKQVPDSGDTVHGYYLPPGTEIAQSMTGIGRTRELFGADSDIFRPERWLEASPQQFDEMASAVDLVFSTAKYICLGKHIALMELGKIVAEVTNPLPRFLGIRRVLLIFDFADFQTLRCCTNQQCHASEDEGSGDLDGLRLLDQVHSQNMNVIVSWVLGWNEISNPCSCHTRTARSNL